MGRSEPHSHILQDNPLAGDLDRILENTQGLWENLRGKCLFITGGTGFFGKWLLESFAWANDRLDLNASAVVLTRNFELFNQSAPHLAANPAIRFHVGDVRDFEFPEAEFSYIIHAATTSAFDTYNNEDPLIKFDTVFEGTRHTLDFALHCRAKKFLLTSSGSIYGKQPSYITHLPEDYTGAPCPNDPNSALGEGKRAAEFLCAYYAIKYGIEVKIARCFSFVGPFLPLDIHYAIGNFIGNGLKGEDIQVLGDGSPYRSYLYASDLVVWLWTILFFGESCRPYNVGSEVNVTIAELANTVAQCFSQSVEVKIAKTVSVDSMPERYVPSTQLAQRTLGVKQTIGLKESIERTISFNRTGYTLSSDQQ
ncbi:MAG: NAD-dependent epimerase/dehydratase family protein [Desulfuromonadaceae bacterium]|nr:NAD-dependent epimerase/dehydratase family protein [Desulfuromonadaceae bacterium]